MNQTLEVRLIEDDEDDVRLTREALKDSKVDVDFDVAPDGEDSYAGAGLPDLILMDLNLPGISGREVLAALKRDETLRRIPVVVLTTSAAETDIIRCYDLGANCYITKPVDFEQFLRIIKSIDNFWFTVVKLPPPDLGKRQRL